MKAVVPLLVLANALWLGKAQAQEVPLMVPTSVASFAPVGESREQAERRLMVEDAYEAPRGILFDENAYFQNQLPVNEFNTIIVVNKAAKGPSAQTLRLYRNRQLLLVTKVSTGREDLEYVTPQDAEEHRRSGKGALESHWRHTTRGFYPLQRIEGPDYQSRENNFHMPYAMFFNEDHGLAVHQVPPDLQGGEAAGEAQLGHRASSGCIRVHKDFIQEIHSEAVAAGIGTIPVLDTRTGQQRRHGWFKRLEQTRGYNTIVIVEEN